jgi:hypothetical protein
MAESGVTRPRREDYVRVTVTHGEHLFELGVEFRAGDAFVPLAVQLRETAAAADGLTCPSERTLAIAERIAATWPDRGYFAEVWRAGEERLFQSYRPIEHHALTARERRLWEALSIAQGLLEARQRSSGGG